MMKEAPFLASMTTCSCCTPSGPSMKRVTCAGSSCGGWVGARVGCGVGRQRVGSAVGGGVVVPPPGGGGRLQPHEQRVEDLLLPVGDREQPQVELHALLLPELGARALGSLGEVAHLMGEGGKPSTLEWPEPGS